MYFMHPLLDGEPGMIKLCQFPAVDQEGRQLLEVFHHPDQLHHSYMDKVAAPFLPEVRDYVDRMNPNPNSIYALVNALGAYEFWSSNINGDAFEEEFLIHKGPIWGYETFLVYAKPFMHHCFRSGTEVVMGNRTRKPISSIKEGEWVETRRGPRRVEEAIKRRYEGPGVKLSLSGVMDKLEASWDHPVFVYRREDIHCSHRYSRLRSEQKHFEEYPTCLEDLGDPREVQIGTVLPGDYMVFPKPKLGGEKVPDKFAELVGWVASEGYCAGERGMIQFTFCEFNYEDIESVTHCLERNGLYVTRTELPDKEQTVLSSWNVNLWDLLQEYVQGVKSEKRLTGKIMTWDERAIRIMFGAYIDGDGHVPEKGQNAGQLRIRSASKKMLNTISDLARALAVPTTIQWDADPGYRTFPHGSTYWCNGSGTLTVTPQFSPELTEFSRKNYARKMKKIHPRMFLHDLFLVLVRDREDTWLEEDLYNLSVDGVQEYVAGEALVHNCNKGPNARAFGAVELSAWNPNMRRVELVVRLDRDAAERVGAHKVIDKIDQGQLPDTSMGCKVPYDLCSITTDWELYRKALSTFNPRRHRHPGVAALIYHKTVRPIRGLSITTDDYSDYAKFQMNKILPDGRKVCVFNPFPRFFDISFVFFGAEKQSKMMAKLASRYFVVPSNYLARQYGYGERDQPRTHKEYEEVEKTASIIDVRTKLQELKKRASQRKQAEIIKNIVPSQFMGKAVPVLEKTEPPLSKGILDQMGSCPIKESLSTPTMMGITLKPHEFQRIVICRLGKRDMADELDRNDQVFRKVDGVDKSINLGPESINGRLADLLKDAIEDRGVFGPVLQRRMVKVVVHGVPDEHPEREEVKDNLLDKVSAAYNGYREQVIEKIADLSRHLSQYPVIQAQIFGQELGDVFVDRVKTAAGVDSRLLLGAIPAAYLVSALARRSAKSDYYKGEDPGLLKEFLGSHPHLAATVVGLAALKAGGSDLPDKLLKGAINVGKHVANLG